MMAMRKIILKTSAARPYTVILKSHVNTEATLFQIIHRTPQTTAFSLNYYLKYFISTANISVKYFINGMQLSYDNLHLK
jgi:hypothetical protein